MRARGWCQRALASALLVLGCARVGASEGPAAPEAASTSLVNAAADPGVGDAAVEAGSPSSEPAADAGREPAPAPDASALPEAQPPVVPAGAPLVAVVDGVPLPRSAFDEIYGLKLAKYTSRGFTIPPSADRRYRVSIVERLVHHERLRRRVVELGEDFDPARATLRIEQSRQAISDWSLHLLRRGETEASLRAMIIAELREELILERAGMLAVSRAEIEAASEGTEDEIVERQRQRKLHEGRRTLKAELEAAYPVTHHVLTVEEQTKPAKRAPPGPGSRSVTVQAPPAGDESE